MAHYKSQFSARSTVKRSGAGISNTDRIVNTLSMLVAYLSHLDQFYEKMIKLRRNSEDLMDEWRLMETMYPAGVTIFGVTFKNPLYSKRKEIEKYTVQTLWTEADINSVADYVEGTVEAIIKPLEDIAKKQGLL